jgi:RNA-directed DNA polymerase
MTMQPLDSTVHYGTTDSNFPEIAATQMELLPEKLHQLRWKLNQKAKNEPKLRFYALYDRVYRMDVLEAAWKHVGKLGKASGIDGLRAEDIISEDGGVEKFLETIHEELKSKSYQPSAVRRVYIAKTNAKERPLGIPTLKDRVVQMAVVLILEPILEADFCDCSYGFRPGRKAHDALEAIRENLKSGRTEVYDADLKSYFDTIPHDKLMACVRMRVTDRSVLNLIRSWLRSPVIEEDNRGKRKPPVKNGKGTPQGGVISPLLANLYLHWFDKAFYWSDGPGKWANARLIRYADDFVIMARYQGARINEWIDRRLEKSQKKAREAIREATCPRMCFKPAPTLVKELNTYLKGWCNYFQYGYPRKAFRDLGHYCYQRMTTHLNRRSQGKYHRPKGQSDYQYLQNLGLYRP